MRERPAPLLEHMGAIGARLAGQEPVLVALDFDGTLTEIVDDPTAPSLTAGQRDVLTRLPGPARRLAIVSGRALGDIRTRVGIRDAIYVGNHGLEIEGPGIEPAWRPDPSLPSRLAMLLSSLPTDGVAQVENKNRTATLHVRPRDDHERHAALGTAIRRRVEAAGFVLRPGKASWEIRPRGAPDKGVVLLDLIASIPGASARHTVYIGDDTTDEDAFRALSEGLTVRVGPTVRGTAAHYSLPSPSAVYEFLERLIAG
ncbi:MAG TPA: trehalose-phosphatase [Gemmatimonadota bacterium]|nr:trehalose-phosphatase [Gemmatimonadota bacterium]